MKCKNHYKETWCRQSSFCDLVLLPRAHSKNTTHSFWRSP